ncbi:porin family protein [Flavobacterium ranwuense]|uniref:Porin family protein n=1 Tax=Flavobacterium ranwuense TaxID=2541725 RepID=A0ABY2DVR3_9FLAO|nr:outer membrane beta-barrel protein [Flavobacterium ranwuense]TDE31722.1 porin family protein [Flavobacterium ranwuense]
MKKGFFIALCVFFGIAQTQAQVTFKPGLRAGLNFSHFTKGDNYYSSSYDPASGGSNANFTTKTDFYIAFYGALKLTKYYTLQPEIEYSEQGSKYNGNTNLNVNYLSLKMLNKFTFNDQFNIHVGPTIDFVVDNNFDTDSDVDLAFVLGAGYNFNSNFGIEARVKKGIVPVIDTDVNHMNVVFQLGVTYTFDVK